MWCKTIYSIPQAYGFTRSNNMTEHNESHMSPNTSPSTLTKVAGTRRVNNLPLYIGGGIFMCFLLTMAYLIGGSSPPKKTAQEEVPTQSTQNTKMYAQSMVGEYTNGVIPDASEKKEVLPSPLEQSNQTTSDQTLPKTNEANLQVRPNQEELKRIRMIKMQQLDAAIKAKTSIPVDLPKTAKKMDTSSTLVSAASRSNDPTTAYKTELAQLQNSGGNGAPTLINASVNNSPAPNNTVDAMGQFVAKAPEEDRWQLNSSTQAPRTPYELRAGFVLPAILISGINSELPGQIMAQITQSVYDTPTGKHLLIPQGSRLVGTYSSEVAYGQSRVLVAWQRITFPDGKALDIGAMPGADSAGYSGFNDQVNNHYVRIFGSAIMMSAITAGFAYSQDVNEEDDWFTAPTASSELSAALGQQLGDVASQMIAKNLNIAPTLEIRPGYLFNVMVTKDLTFSHPYQSFDY